MSFARNPPKVYTPWKPNDDFAKFFDDLKKRRIPADDSTSLVRVSNNPSPQSGSSSNNNNNNSRTTPNSSRGISISHNYSTPSQILVNTARDLTGAINNGGCLKKRGTSKNQNILAGQLLKKKKQKQKETTTTTTSTNNKGGKAVKRSAILERRLREARL